MYLSQNVDPLPTKKKGTKESTDSVTSRRESFNVSLKNSLRLLVAIAYAFQSFPSQIRLIITCHRAMVHLSREGSFFHEFVSNFQSVNLGIDILTGEAGFLASRQGV